LFNHLILSLAFLFPKHSSSIDLPIVEARRYCEMVTAEYSLSGMESLNRLFTDSYALQESLSQISREFENITGDSSTLKPADKRRLYAGKLPNQFWTDLLRPNVDLVARNLKTMYPELNIKLDRANATLTLQAPSHMVEKYDSPLIDKLILAENLGMKSVFSPMRLLASGGMGLVADKTLFLSFDAVTKPFHHLTTESHELVHALFDHDLSLGLTVPELARWDSRAEEQDVSRTNYAEYLHGQEHYTFLESLRASRQNLENLNKALPVISPTLRSDLRGDVEREILEGKGVLRIWTMLYEEKRAQLLELKDAISKRSSTPYKVKHSKDTSPDSTHYPMITEITIFSETGEKLYTHGLQSKERPEETEIVAAIDKMLSQLEELKLKFQAEAGHFLNQRRDSDNLLNHQSIKKATSELKGSPFIQREVLLTFIRILRPKTKPSQIYTYSNLSQHGLKLAAQSNFLYQNGVPTHTILSLYEKNGELDWVEKLSPQLFPIVVKQLSSRESELLGGQTPSPPKASLPGIDPKDFMKSAEVKSARRIPAIKIPIFSSHGELSIDGNPHKFFPITEKNIQLQQNSLIEDRLVQLFEGKFTPKQQLVMAGNTLGRAEPITASSSQEMEKILDFIFDPRSLTTFQLKANRPLYEIILKTSSQRVSWMFENIASPEQIQVIKERIDLLKRAIEHQAAFL